MAHATFMESVSGFGLIAMSPQDDACRSGCISSLSCRLFLCGRCHRQVVICRRCDRGQIYCGPECALEVRRRNQREARRRYQASDRGRRMHAERSRQYRAGGRRVTDQGPALVARPDRQPPTPRAATMAARRPAMVVAGRVTACCRCGIPVSDRVRLSPIRRPYRRQLVDRSGQPTRRRRR